MNIEIRKLTPDLLEDYISFFETDAHLDNPHEDRCYCVCWSSADDRVGTDYSSPEKRRDLAIEYINRGMIQGYLAYEDDKIIGWCNANTRSDCLKCTSWLRFKNAVIINDKKADIKIKSIFCFTIIPDMRQKGIATQLLERVCKEAAKEGFQFVEAYPQQQFKNVFNAHGGPLELYMKSGFEIFQEVNDKYKGVFDIKYYTVRKSLI